MNYFFAFTYSKSKRLAEARAELGRYAYRRNTSNHQNIRRQDCTFFIEDNPYGELRFIGEDKPSMRTFRGDDCVQLGSFTKIVSPGIRLGWITACPEIMETRIVARQASGATNTMRLNFSNSDEDKISTGIIRLARVIKSLESYLILKNILMNILFYDAKFYFQRYHD